MARQPYSKNTRPNLYYPSIPMNRVQSLGTFGTGSKNERTAQILELELRRLQAINNAQSQSRATPKRRK